MHFEKLLHPGLPGIFKYMIVKSVSFHQVVRIYFYTTHAFIVNYAAIGIFLSNGVQFDICNSMEEIGGIDGTGENEENCETNGTGVTGGSEGTDASSLDEFTFTAVTKSQPNIETSTTNSPTNITTIHTPIFSTPFLIGLSCDNANVSWKSILYRALVYLFWLFILVDVFFIWLPSPVSIFEFIIGPTFFDLALRSQHNIYTDVSIQNYLKHGNFEKMDSK